jgi:hypothetical protein
VKTILFLSVFSIFLLPALTFSKASIASVVTPDIEAHRFNTKVIQKSTSGKIYLFESATLPKTGNLILIYEKDHPTMAFRILKNDQEKNQFVGKRIRRYEGGNDLDVNKSYTTIEKLADLLPAPGNLSKPILADSNTPAEPEPVKEIAEQKSAEEPIPPAEPTEEPTAITQSDSNEVEPEKIDPELDANTVTKLDAIDRDNPNDDLEDYSKIEFDEFPLLDPLNNMIVVGTGYFGNASNFSLAPVYNNGVGISFTRVMFRDVFLDSKTIQDALSLELGVVQYSILNLDRNNDNYSLLPFYANLIYQLYPGKTFGAHAYGGLQYNYMLSASNAGSSIEDLQGFQPNFGVGMTYRMGPQWYLRADIGWDRIAAGLGIKW